MAQDLSGNWTGTIIYGKGYPANRGKELYFDLELAHHGDSIVGIAKDIGGEGMSPDEAEVEGTFKQDQIKFVKQYISLHYYTKTGTQIDRSKRGPIIIYTGSFNTNEETFMGEWNIKYRTWFLGIIPLNANCGGTWSMKRK